MNTKYIIGATLAAAVALSSAAFAVVQHLDNDEIPALRAQLSAAKITLAEAALAAEINTQGKATSVSIEHDSKQLAYKVEVLKGDQLFDVTVDSVDGKVLSVVADKGDEKGEATDNDGDKD